MAGWGSHDRALQTLVSRSSRLDNEFSRQKVGSMKMAHGIHKTSSNMIDDVSFSNILRFFDLKWQSKSDC